MSDKSRKHPCFTNSQKKVKNIWRVLRGNDGKKRKSIPLSLTLGKVESESRLSVLFLGKEQLESSSQIQITESEIESMLSLRKVQT